MGGSNSEWIRILKSWDLNEILGTPDIGKYVNDKLRRDFFCWYVAVKFNFSTGLTYDDYKQTVENNVSKTLNYNQTITFESFSSEK